jgi:hypothetical protein
VKIAQDAAASLGAVVVQQGRLRTGLGLRVLSAETAEERVGRAQPPQRLT